MRFLIVSFALAAVASAQYQPTVYKQPAPPGSESHAAILRQAAEVNPDGSYAWSYETDHGIAAAESGAVKAIGPNGEPANDVVGEYSYTAPDGQLVAVKYSAGPQGFVPTGSHIPVAPPIPELILRSLAYNAAHPHKEEVDYSYKGEPQKPYYPQPTPKPIYEPIQYTTPKTYYPQPTYQPAYQPGFPQRPVAYTPQNYFNQPGRR